MRSTKQLVGIEGREKLLSGINKMADAVKSTLGPMGRNVLIQDEYGNVKTTKDGVSVAKALYLQDELENLAASVLREVSVKTNDVAGDGTTTAMVLAQAIIKSAFHYINDKSLNAIDCKRGIDYEVEQICSYIDSIKKPITLSDEFVLESVASISTNNDPVLGKMLAQAFIAVGESGRVTVHEGKSVDTYFQKNEGISFSRGYTSSSFINNMKNRSCEFNEGCYILLVGEKITDIDSFFNFLQISQNREVKSPVLVICEDIDEKIVNLLAINKLKGIIDVCVIKSPGLNLERRDLLEDIAISVGGKVISSTEGYSFQHASIDDYGFAESIKVTDNTTTIIGGAKNAEKFEERIDVLKGQIEATEEQMLKDRITERIAKLKGGIGIIYAGGSSEFEIAEKIDRIQDGIHAVQAVLEDGIVPGGGFALLRYRSDYDLTFLKQAITAPLVQMLINSGFHKDNTSNFLDKMKTESIEVGYDIKHNVRVDNMYEHGIIDSAKVVKSALRNAGSVAGLFITTEYVIANSEYKEQY